MPTPRPIPSSSRHSLICAVLSAAILALAGCGVGFDGGGGGPPEISIVPQVRGVAVNSNITFTATSPTSTIDPRQAVWNFNTDPTISGSFTPSTGATVTYTAPVTPPIYAAAVDPLLQGTVVLRANIVGNTAATVVFQVTAPTVTASLLPATATVALGATQQFFGYAVGAINNGVTWQVNGVTGGNGQVGTISATGFYTAPSTLPVTGITITLTLISAADPTRTATSTITLK